MNEDEEKRLNSSREKYKDVLDSESDIDFRVNNIHELEDIENKDHIVKTTKHVY